MPYETIIAKTEYAVALVQLNRPDRMNALNSRVMSELTNALDDFDKDDAVRCIIIHGNARAFSAGADIDEMKSVTPAEMLRKNSLVYWDRIKRISKPIIAAVSGYCLGGGCELAMACDMIIASESAQFGQPEINIGIMPGAGGTQRLTRTIGKSRAMELVLSGKFMTANEAQARGLVSRVVPIELYLDEAKLLAKEIATRAPVAVRLAKEAINKAYEMPLADGLDYERRLFYLLFATEDQREGMDAFLNKRKPEWKGK